MVRAESGGLRGSFRGSVVRPLDHAFLKIRFGRNLARRLTEANLRSLYTLEYAVIGLAAVGLTFAIVQAHVALFYALLITVAVLWSLFKLLSYLRNRQYRLFLAQLPELARILANSTSAGLSIRSALQIAAGELSDPAGRELAVLNDELSIGTPIDIALERMEERIPGRDLAVLIGTLVISQRSGGSLITALRGMAQALEDRKETTREVRTLITQASYTGYVVVAFGVGLVLMFNVLSPGLLLDLTTSVIGQIALFVTAISYVIGLTLIQKLTRVKV